MRSTKYTSVSGSNLVFYRGTDRRRWIDAFGDNVYKLVEEWVNTPVDDTTALPTAWTNTRVQTGTGNTTFGFVAGQTGNAAIITTDDADNDGLNMQLLGEGVKLITSCPLYFGIKFTLSEATQSDFLVGVAITDTDALGGLTDGVYFRKVDGATAVTCVIEKDSTETASSTLLTADTSSHTLEFFFDGAGTVTPFVDGTASTALSGSNLPDDEFLTPTIHFLSGSAGAKTMTIDWVRCIQLN